jgi:hypothetical protein
MRLFLNSSLHRFRVIDYTICLYSAPSGHEGTESPFNRNTEYFLFIYLEIVKTPLVEISHCRNHLFLIMSQKFKLNVTVTYQVIRQTLYLARYFCGFNSSSFSFDTKRQYDFVGHFSGTKISNVNRPAELFIQKPISIRLMKDICVTEKQQLRFVWCR